MKYSESLKKNRDFRLVYKEGKSCANKYLVMYIRENHSDVNRLGISVSKKVGNSIVRHRITRLIRESYRLQEEHFKCGWDLVWVADSWCERKNISRNRERIEVLRTLIHGSGLTLAIRN